jgi:ATP-dependent DNA helicase RecQ
VENEMTGKARTALVDEERFGQLRALRRDLADAQKVPSYIVFTDAVLYGMCAALPKNGAELLAIPGVGQAKLEKYGKRFLQVIHDWQMSRQKTSPSPPGP